jgi:hypothetical protein
MSLLTSWAAFTAENGLPDLNPGLPAGGPNPCIADNQGMDRQ